MILFHQIALLHYNFKKFAINKNICYP